MGQYKPSVTFTEQEAVEAPYKKGDFIGTKYEVYGVLGWGGFGIVYLVYDHQTKDVYALKTFRDKYLQNAEIRERFRKEADTWVKLERHPYLVRAYWVDEVGGRLYITMEYIAPTDKEGRLNSIHGYLGWSPPDLAQSLRWAIQFCHGMEHVYSKGIPRHGDIKPDNIMISYDKTVKISDFGLAGALPQEAVGARGYIAPEILDGKEADVRSDIYSFGIVLYQMATQNPDPPQRGWFGRIPSVNGPMQAIVQRCLNNNSDKRYLSFKDLRGELEILLKKETGEVIKPPELTELEAWELSNKGTSLAHLGRPDEAILCYKKALEINPRFAGAYYNRGLAYAQGKGEFDRAINDYNRAIELNPRDVKAYYNRGLAYDKKGEFGRAINDYTSAIEINPRYAEAYNNRGLAYSDKGEFDRAINDFNRAIEINPRYAEAYNNRGTVYHAGKGEFDRVINDFNRAIEINPRYALAYNNRGNAYHKKGEFDRAINDFNRAIEINPRDALAYDNRGIAYDGKGEFDRAINDFNRAIEINPRDALAYNNRGIAYHKKGKFDRAINDYTSAIEINPRYAEVYNNRGIAYDGKGEFDRAINDYTSAIEINPRDDEAYYNRGDAYQSKGKFDRAINDYNEAIKINPSFAEAYYNRAGAYFAIGEYDKAWEDVYKAQELGYQVNPGFLDALRQASGR